MTPKTRLFIKVYQNADLDEPYFSIIFTIVLVFIKVPILNIKQIFKNIFTNQIFTKTKEYKKKNESMQFWLAEKFI